MEMVPGSPACVPPAQPRPSGSSAPALPFPRARQNHTHTRHKIAHVFISRRHGHTLRATRATLGGGRPGKRLPGAGSWRRSGKGSGGEGRVCTRGPARRPSTQGGGHPLGSISLCPRSCPVGHFTCGRQRQREALLGAGLGARTPSPPACPAAHLEQGDGCAVEEAEQEQDDEGGGHGVEVLKALLLGAHLPRCRDTTWGSVLHPKPPPRPPISHFHGPWQCCSRRTGRGGAVWQQKRNHSDSLMGGGQSPGCRVTAAHRHTWVPQGWDGVTQWSAS